tara:strand:+ start:53 stop:421 length:369 start_codon:yes stop_codon:yes gene_type:complete
MGLFGNLFKEKVNWNENELKALLAVLLAQAGIDGNLDDDEKNFIGVCMDNIPGFKSDNWTEFTVSSTKISPEIHFETLRNMHSDKKKVLLATVALIAGVDGDFDDKEAEFFANLAGMLNVTI